MSGAKDTARIFLVSQAEGPVRVILVNYPKDKTRRFKRSDYWECRFKYNHSYTQPEKTQTLKMKNPDNTGLQCAHNAM